jgi:hypothetical protein
MYLEAGKSKQPHGIKVEASMTDNIREFASV